MELGLGQRDVLAADGWHAFFFRRSGLYQFWMKDMRLLFDIVWIDGNKTVIGVARPSTGTYPLTVAPPKPDPVRA